MSKKKKAAKGKKGGNGNGNGKKSKVPGRPSKCDEMPYSNGCKKTRKRNGKTCQQCQAVR